MSACFHFSAKPIARSAGHSASAAAAYRGGMQLKDDRTGMTYDFTKKSGVINRAAPVFLPGGSRANCREFWNEVEKHHKRGDAVVAREVEASLPSSLPAETRQELAYQLAQDLADEYGVGAHPSLHEPRRITEEDLRRKPDQYWEIDPHTGKVHNGNWHVHIILSACSSDSTGKLGRKVESLDPISCQRSGILNLAETWREKWADMQNAALKQHNCPERVDHRSLKDQGVNRAPTKHLGPTAAAIERKSPGVSEVMQRIEAENVENLLANKRQIEAEEMAAVEKANKILIEIQAAESAKEIRDGIRRAALSAIEENIRSSISLNRECDEAYEAASRTLRCIAEIAETQHRRRIEESVGAIGDQLRQFVRAVGRSLTKITAKVAYIVGYIVGEINRQSKLQSVAKGDTSRDSVSDNTFPQPPPPEPPPKSRRFKP